MTTQQVVEDAEAVVDAFIALQESNRGTELATILTEDAVLDLNVPQWRFQVGGATEIAGAFAQSYPEGFRTTRCHADPTPGGAVVEYDGWDVARDLYYRHLAVLRIRDGRIARLTLYCTGAWDTETIENQHREAPMVDTATTGAR